MAGVGWMTLFFIHRGDMSTFAPVDMKSDVHPTHGLPIGCLR